MKKIELLLPAGNLEKLKFALLYGADSVYIGGEKYSLRAQASNFTLSDIKEAVSFAHERGKKVYVTVNVIPREKEIKGVVEFLIQLEKLKIDGIIVSSPAILKLAKDNTNLHISISTQSSIINKDSVNLLHSLGYDRVVLGRELSISEIKYIKENTKAEIEVFIHGGMCSGFSGRCTMSNYMSNRDANRGGCAHSCRWIYDIYKDDKKINDYTFNIGSKDLNGVNFIKDLYDIGIDSLKVEGRMKSLHYVATIAYTYRMLLDDIESGNMKDISFYQNLLESSENRDHYSGFLSGKIDNNLTLYSKTSPEANQSFLGIVLKYDKEKSIATVEVRNHFIEGEVMEVMSPRKELFNVKALKLYKDKERVKDARHALEILEIEVDKDLKINDILRRK